MTETRFQLPGHSGQVCVESTLVADKLTFLQVWNRASFFPDMSFDAFPHQDILVFICFCVSHVTPCNVTSKPVMECPSPLHWTALYFCGVAGACLTLWFEVSLNCSILLLQPCRWAHQGAASTSHCSLTDFLVPHHLQCLWLSWASR